MENRVGKRTLAETYNSNAAAEAAVKQLKSGGFEMKNLSIVTKDFESERDVVGFYNAGDRMKSWGKFGAMWGGMWGLLFGAGFFLVPGFGPVAISGHLASILIGMLEGATIYGGLSVIGGALFSLGIPKDSVLKYETEIKAGKYLLLAHGTEAEVSQAKKILIGSLAQSRETFAA